MGQFPDPNWQNQQGPAGVPNYYSGGPAQMGSRRPGAVTGLAITGIVLGILGILCCGFTTVMATLMLGNGGRNPMAPQMPATDPALVNFQVFQGALNLIMAIILLVGSVAALSLKPFARTLIMLWSVTMIVWAVVNTAIGIVWVNPQNQKMLQQMGSQAPNASAISGMANVIVVISCLLWCVMPVLFLVMWSRPHVKAAFGQGSTDGLMQPPFGQ